MINLVLVVITGIYAYLTWRMVSEMRSARENQVDANVIASPVPFGSVYAQVQMQNAGPGPALDVELSVSLHPPLETDKRTWRYPALLVNQKQHFLLSTGEGGIDALQELGEKHEDVLVEVKWKNIFGRERSFSESYNLRELAEGWYTAGNLIPPGDMETQMKDLREILKKMRQDLEKIARALAK